MKPLLLYTIFHLNLAYSSIEEGQRGDVIERCYWPLLRLARRYGLPFGIEATAWTLETVRDIDPAWFEELRRLVNEGPCEFVGSGYVQLIGPLVPATVNAANLRLGHQVYERLLGFRPRVALVNEQAYSPGLLEHYLDAGYRAIVMEWDNPARCHPEWNAEWRYLPQYACRAESEEERARSKEQSAKSREQEAESKEQGAKSRKRGYTPQSPGSVRHVPDAMLDAPRSTLHAACSTPSAAEIPVIWNKSIAFQKFQRYAHGEMELDEYLKYLCGHLAETPRAFALYGNDIEIFDFRPGRYHTEATLGEQSEWDRIGRLFDGLLTDDRFRFIPPSQVLNLLDQPEAGNRLHLESSEQPIPVKKQGKYNVSRWAVSNRQELWANTNCWRIYEQLKSSGNTVDDDWRELCYLWSSDFRTHITDRRWAAFQQRMRKMLERTLGPDSVSATNSSVSIQNSPHAEPIKPRDDQLDVVGVSSERTQRPVTIKRSGRLLLIETPDTHLKLNCRRGLAIESLAFTAQGESAWCGTLPHGYYDDVQWAADYYSGHLVFEAPGVPKVTDLNPGEPTIAECPERGCVHILAEITTTLGPIGKQISVDLNSPRIEFRYEIPWPVPPGSLRLGHVTLMPEQFERHNLFYATHNGGAHLEQHPLGTVHVDHGRPVSFLVSANQALGMTEGVAVIGDRTRCLRVEVDKSCAALLGLVNFTPIGSRYFCRLSLTARELDDTSRPTSAGQGEGLIIRFAFCPDDATQSHKFVT